MGPVLKTGVVKATVGSNPTLAEMTEKLRNNIETFSAIFRKEYKLEIPILSLNDLIKELGGKILYGEGIEKEGDSFIIKIKEDPYSARGRFNILKALGVLIFENGLLIDKEKWENTKEIQYPDSYEIANEFAASMLMPRNIFIDYFTDDYNIEDTANHFGTNYDLVRSRAKWLGLILF